MYYDIESLCMHHYQNDNNKAIISQRRRIITITRHTLYK